MRLGRAWREVGEQWRCIGPWVRLLETVWMKNTTKISAKGGQMCLATRRYFTGMPLKLKETES